MTRVLHIHILSYLIFAYPAANLEKQKDALENTFSKEDFSFGLFCFEKEKEGIVFISIQLYYTRNNSENFFQYLNEKNSKRAQAVIIDNISFKLEIQKPKHKGFLDFKNRSTESELPSILLAELKNLFEGNEKVKKLKFTFSNVLVKYTKENPSEEEVLLNVPFFNNKTLNNEKGSNNVELKVKWFNDGNSRVSLKRIEILPTRSNEKEKQVGVLSSPIITKLISTLIRTNTNKLNKTKEKQNILYRVTNKLNNYYLDFISFETTLTKIREPIRTPIKTFSFQITHEDFKKYFTESREIIFEEMVTDGWFHDNFKERVQTDLDFYSKNSFSGVCFLISYALTKCDKDATILLEVRRDKGLSGANQCEVVLYKKERIILRLEFKKFLNVLYRNNFKQGVLAPSFLFEFCSACKEGSKEEAERSESQRSSPGGSKAVTPAKKTFAVIVVIFVVVVGLFCFGFSAFVIVSELGFTGFS